MKVSKVLTYCGCLLLTLALLWTVMSIRPVRADAPVATSEFPPPIIEVPTPTAVDPIEQFALYRDQGVEVVLAYARSLDDATRASLRSEIDALVHSDGTLSPANIEATPYVGINNGGCVYDSMQAAIDVANQGDTIKVTAGTHYDNPVIAGTWLTIEGGYASDCLTHSGGVTTLDGDAANSVFNISNNTVTLRDFAITDGGGYGAGLYVWNGAQVTLDHTEVTLNNGIIGGGVYIDGLSTLTATNNSPIHHNAASYRGGGVAVYGQFSGMDNDSDIYLNSAPNGGGIYASGGVVLLNTADISQNQATATDGKGGGIYAINGSDITVDNSAFVYYQNTAYNGAGLYADASAIRLSRNATFRDNHATNYGGGLYLTNGCTLLGTDSQIGQNTTGQHNEAVVGGGMYVMTSTVELLRSSIINNVAVSIGAGLYADASTITMTDVLIGGTGANQSNLLTGSGTAFGGGIYLNDHSVATLQDTEVTKNIASGSPSAVGGLGVYVNYSTLKMTDSRIQQHRAISTNAGRGAGLYIDTGYVTLSNSGVYSNVASHSGGGIRIYSTGVLTLENSVIQNNKSTTSIGGGIGAQYGVFGPPTLNLISTDIISNSAETDGGGVYLNAGTLDIDDAFFFDRNRAKNDGGAIYAANATVNIDISHTVCDPTITECNVFSDNYADSDSSSAGNGGAIYSLDSQFRVNHARFYGNNAYKGGGIFQEGTGTDLEMQVLNTLLHDNEVTSGLGAAIRSEGGDVLLRHVTVADNLGGAGYSQSNTDSVINQSIAWGNSNGGFWVTSGTMNGICNIDQSANVGAAENPVFVDAACNNFHLHYTSPAVDVCVGGLPVDLDGNARPIGAAYDMGAYERVWDTTFLPMALKDM